MTSNGKMNVRHPVLREMEKRLGVHSDRARMITSRRMADTDVLPPKAGAYLFMILQVAGFDVDRDVGGPRRVSGATLLTRLHETMDAILFKNRVEIHSFFDTCAEDRPPWTDAAYIRYINSLLSFGFGLALKQDVDDAGYGLVDELAGLLGGPGQPPRPAWPPHRDGTDGKH
jgi:hypothetical protein